jgi:predicted transcriptional regulator
MEIPQIFESEYRLCLIVWEQEPVNSTKLVALSKERLEWSKATTYTVLRRLAERGVLQNQDAVVTSLVTKQQVQQSQLAQMMDKTFEGSIPAFIAAFSSCHKLTREEVAQMEAFIHGFKE